MAIRISGTIVINDNAELASGLKSLYDVISSTAVDRTLVNREFCNVTDGGKTITLPGPPHPGWEVVIGVGNFANTIVGRNGSKIMSLAEDMTIDGVYSTVNLVYIDETIGWRIS